MVYFSSPLIRWRLRRISGGAPTPVVGHVPAIIKLGSPNWILQQRAKHGPVFQMWLGAVGTVVLTNPEHVRVAGEKLLNRTPPSILLTEKHLVEAELSGLVAAKNDSWHAARSAWLPALTPASLQGYSHLMQQGADRLAQRLAAAAAGGRVVCMWRELSGMSLQVVASTAYGVSVPAMEAPVPGDSTPGAQLVQACSDMLEYSSESKGSWYRFLDLIMPDSRLGFVLVAKVLPDKAFAALLQHTGVSRSAHRSRARRSNRVCEAARPWTRPTHPWRRNETHTRGVETPPRHATAPAAGATTASAATAVDGAGAMAGDARQTLHAAGTSLVAAWGESQSTVKPIGCVAVAMGSPGAGVQGFLGQLLQSRAEAGGAGLTDAQIIAQSQSFVTAGSETTASALAFAVHLIARHPEVQARLLAEIDAFGSGAPVSEQDLQQFPYLEAVFSETLRLFPPTHLANRHAAEGLNVGGVRDPGRDAGVPVHQRDPPRPRDLATL
ncbi:MAG: hypothetical protein WDW36_006398 [Sanguina aurantia]